MAGTMRNKSVGHASGAGISQHPIIALVVEDHESVVKEVRDRLQSLKHDLVVATNQQEAEACLESTLFDYILLDITIPSSPGARAREQNGRNLLVYIRQKPGYGGVPVIIMTAYGATSPVLGISLMKSGATDFINKPFDDSIESLESKIQEALHKSRQSTSGKDLKPFQGGELVFFSRRVELHFDRFKIKVSGSRRNALICSILEFLRRNADSTPRPICDGKYIAQHVNAGVRGEAAIREAVYTFRSFCSEQLASHGYKCDRDDIISNETHDGYHFGTLIRLRTDLLKAERPDTTLAGKQEAICLVLKRSSMSRREIADQLGLTVEQIAAALRTLVKAGQIKRQGSGAKAVFSLAQ